MPTRLIREGINSSPRVNALSLGAEVLYRRLMSVVDDYGRFYASPGTVRGACWPTCPERIQDAEINDWLAECCTGDKPLVVAYEAKGCRYLQLSDFGQKVRSKSKFPEPNEHILTICEQSVRNLLTICPQPADNLQTIASNLQTIAGNLPALVGGVVVVEDGGVLPPKSFSKTEDPDALLERLYSAHPKKGDRGLAESYLASAIIGGVSAEKIERNHKLCCELEPSFTDQGGKFAPTLAKWLLDRGYNYPPKTTPAIPAKPQRGLQSPYNDPMFCALNELEDRIKAEDAAKAAAIGKN